MDQHEIRFEGLDRVANLVNRNVTPSLIECYASLDPSAPVDYRALAAILAYEWEDQCPCFVGLGGGQGAGKSTLGRLLESASSKIGIRVCVLSLDDFYLPLSERRELAKRVHPLLDTRGPPGTHEIARCRDVMLELRQDREVEIPVFDKGLDDRVGIRRVHGPFDIALLEGWCVGAQAIPEKNLLEPANSLERERDTDGDWRRYVNAQLAGGYAEVSSLLDYLAFLRVPDLQSIRRWRLEQESIRPEAQRLSPEAVGSFVQYFERITIAMLADISPRADLIVELANDHSIARAGIRSTEAVR